MLVLSNPDEHGKTPVAIVCCQHGDERFGLEIFSYFKKRLNEYSGLKLVIANQEAVKRNVRYVDQDLNRSYPGSLKGSREARLAKQVLHEVRASRYVLDIHTTTCPVKMTPIIVGLDAGTKRIIHFSPWEKVARMSKSFASKALIGHIKSGVSLEYGRVYAREHKLEALNVARDIVDGLIDRRTGKKKRRSVYLIDRTIPLDTVIPRSAKELVWSRELGVYPFLLGEKAYRKIAKGFAAKKKSEMDI